MAGKECLADVCSEKVRPVDPAQATVCRVRLTHFNLTALLDMPLHGLMCICLSSICACQQHNEVLHAQRILQLLVVC